MDLSLSEEQQLLKDSVSRFVQENYSVERRRALRDSDDGFDADNWRQFAELGWLAMPFEEADGGYGGTALELMVLMEEFGRGLVAEPYLANIVLCGGLLSGASNAQRAQLLTPLMNGETQWAFAFAEPRSRYRLADVSVTATPDGDAYILSGEKIAVLNGHCARYLLVSARTSGEQRERDGIRLLIVFTTSSQVVRRG
jgi:alkylation response protein AidB-like acyl-CoA dehydrogenase